MRFPPRCRAGFGGLEGDSSWWCVCVRAHACALSLLDKDTNRGVVPRQDGVTSAARCPLLVSWVTSCYVILDTILYASVSHQ